MLLPPLCSLVVLSFRVRAAPKDSLESCCSVPVSLTSSLYMLVKTTSRHGSTYPSFRHTESEHGLNLTTYLGYLLQNILEVGDGTDPRIFVLEQHVAVVFTDNTTSQLCEDTGIQRVLARRQFLPVLNRYVQHVL